jgi:hypothetical protein
VTQNFCLDKVPYLSSVVSLQGGDLRGLCSNHLIREIHRETRVFAAGASHHEIDACDSVVSSISRKLLQSNIRLRCADAGVLQRSKPAIFTVSSMIVKSVDSKPPAFSVQAGQFCMIWFGRSSAVNLHGNKFNIPSVWRLSDFKNGILRSR